jgi:HK97 family phage portal protein
MFGFEIARTKAQPPVPAQNITGDRGAWWHPIGPIVSEPYTGAWQHNQYLRVETTLMYFAVYSCVTLIASDIGKLWLKLVELDKDGIWNEIEVPAFSPVLRKPNRYQTRQKFIENWITSKLIHGNTYILKEKDLRGIVIALYVLDPMRVKVLVAPDGEVFYQLSSNDLAGVEDQVIVPASEIIHDRMSCLYHPLCGVSPMASCALSALQGLSIQRNSNQFFQNGSNPGGIITAPGPITQDAAKRIKDYWETNYTGNNVGKVAVLGDGLVYQTVAIKAEEAQLIEQLKWSAETVCSVFHVPPHMISVGAIPPYNNIEAINQQYYAQCLQQLIESCESLLDEGLGLTAVGGKTYGVEFDLNDLLRMDTATKGKTWGDLVKGAIASPNEARYQFNLPPVPGGESPLSQQQNYSLEALSKRDAKDDPFATTPPPAPPADDAADKEDVKEEEEEQTEEEKKAIIALGIMELTARLNQPGAFA